MSKRDDRKLQEVVHSLNRLYLERSKIYKKEKDLRRELAVISRRRGAEGQSSSVVEQATSETAMTASGLKRDRFANKIKVGDIVKIFNVR